MDMQEYKVVYSVKGETLFLILFAKNRDDAIEWTRRHARVPIRIKSAAMTDKPKSKGGRPKKEAPGTNVVQGNFSSPEEALIRQAYERVQATPFSGVAIGLYLKRVMALNPTTNTMKLAIMHVVRSVEAYEDKLSQKRRV